MQRRTTGVISSPDKLGNDHGFIFAGPHDTKSRRKQLAAWAERVPSMPAADELTVAEHSGMKDGSILRDRRRRRTH